MQGLKADLVSRLQAAIDSETAGGPKQPEEDSGPASSEPNPTADKPSPASSDEGTATDAADATPTEEPENPAAAVEEPAAIDTSDAAPGAVACGPFTSHPVDIEEEATGEVDAQAKAETGAAATAMETDAQAEPAAPEDTKADAMVGVAVEPVKEEAAYEPMEEVKTGIQEGLVNAAEHTEEVNAEKQDGAADCEPMEEVKTESLPQPPAAAPSALSTDKASGNIVHVILCPMALCKFCAWRDL